MAASTVSLQSFDGQTAAQIAAAMNTYFTANPSVWLIDWSFNKNLDRQKGSVRALLQEGNDSAGSRLVALGVDSVSASAAESAIQTFVAANPEYLPIAHLVLTLRQNTEPGGELSVLWLFVDGSSSGYAGTPAGMLIAEPIGNIAAGASGDAQIYTPDGGLGDIRPITNGSATTVWVAGERNYVFPDPTTMVLTGLPSGCGVSTGTLATITSPYCMPPPNGSLEIITMEVVNLAATSLTVRSTYTNTSESFGVILPAGEPTPTAVSILDQTVPGALSYAEEPRRFNTQNCDLDFSGLVSGTDYEIFWFAQIADAGGAGRTGVYSITATTL